MLLAAQSSITEQRGFQGLEKGCQLRVKVYVVAKIAD